jgi:hypothetical protein
MGGRRLREADTPNVNANLPSYISVTSETTVASLGASNMGGTKVFLKLNEQTQ